jgi:hypothetical protein
LNVTATPNILDENNVKVLQVTPEEVKIILSLNQSSKLDIHLNLQNLEMLTDEENSRLDIVNEFVLSNRTDVDIIYNSTLFHAMSSFLRESIEEVSQTAEIMTPITMSGSFLPIIFLRKFSFFFSLMACVQTASLFLLINIDYPPMVSYFLEKLYLSHFEFIPISWRNILKIKIREGLGNSNLDILPDQRPPYRFFQLNMSSNLFENADSQIQYILGAYILIIIIRISSHLLNSKHQAMRTIIAMDNFCRYSLLILIHDICCFKLFWLPIFN